MPVPTTSYPPDPNDSSLTGAAPIAWEDTALLYQGFRDLVNESKLPPSLRGTPWQAFQKKKYTVTSFVTRTINVVWERYSESSSFDNYIEPASGAGMLASLNDAEMEVLLENDLHIRFKNTDCFCCAVAQVYKDSNVVRINNSTGSASDCTHNYYIAGSPTLYSYTSTGTVNIPANSLFNSPVLLYAIKGGYRPTQFATISGGGSDVGTYVGSIGSGCNSYRVTYEVYLDANGVKRLFVSKIERLGLQAEFCWRIRARYYRNEILPMMRLAGATRSITSDWFAPGSDYYKIKKGHAATEAMIFWKARKEYPSLDLAYPNYASWDGHGFVLLNPYITDPLFNYDGPPGICKVAECNTGSGSTPGDLLFNCNSQTPNIPSMFPNNGVGDPFFNPGSCSSKVYAKTFRHMGAFLKVLQQYTSTSNYLNEICIPVGGIVYGCGCCSNPRIKKVSYDHYYRTNDAGEWVIGGIIDNDPVFDQITISDVNPAADGCESMTGQEAISFLPVGYFGLDEEDCYAIYPALEIFHNGTQPQGNFYVYSAMYGEKILVNNSDCKGCSCGNGYCYPFVELVCSSSGGIGGVSASLEYESVTGNIVYLTASQTGSLTRVRYTYFNGNPQQNPASSETYTYTWTFGGEWSLQNGGTLTCTYRLTDASGEELYSYVSSTNDYGPTGIPSGVDITETSGSTDTSRTWIDESYLGIADLDGYGVFNRERIYYDPVHNEFKNVYDNQPAPEGADWFLYQESSLTKSGDGLVWSATKGVGPGVPGTLSTAYTGEDGASGTKVTIKLTVQGTPNDTKTLTLVFITSCQVPPGQAAPPPSYQSKTVTVTFGSDGKGTSSVTIPQPSAGCSTSLHCIIAAGDTGTSCCSIDYPQGAEDPCQNVPDQTFSYVVKVYGRTDTAYTVQVNSTNPETGQPGTPVELVVTTNSSGVGYSSTSDTYTGNFCVTSALIISPTG